MNFAIRALAALAQETRLRAFHLLVQSGGEGLPAGRIAETLGTALPTLSFHLKEMQNAGLIQSQSVSRFVIYRANVEAMDALLDFLAVHCRSGAGSVEPAAAAAPAPASDPRLG